MNAAASADRWARGALRHAGFSARIIQKAADRLAGAFRAAVTGLKTGGAAGAASRSEGQLMLVLSDDEGELAFELIADGDRREAAFAEEQDERGSRWDAIERRVAGDGVTCLRLRAAE